MGERMMKRLSLVLLALASLLAAVACSSKSNSPGDQGPLATQVAQLDQRVKRLEQLVQTPGIARSTPLPSSTQPPGTAGVSTPTLPVPLATLTAKITTGSFTLVKEWQGDRPRKLEGFSATAPWVIFWTLTGADQKAPFKVQVSRVGETQPLASSIDSAQDNQGRQFLFESGSFQLDVTGAGVWQLRVANIQ